MVFTTISLALVSIIKGSGAFIALMCAHSAFHMALDNGGWYIVMYVVALYLVGLSGLCLFDSASEFLTILSQLFSDEGDNMDEEP